MDIRILLFFFALLQFIACRNDNIIETEELNGLVIDTINTRGFKTQQIEKQLNFNRSADSLNVDLNEDGMDDLKFLFKEQHFVSGYSSQLTQIELLNSNCDIFGFQSIDTIITYVIEDTTNNRFCTYTLNYDANKHQNLDSIQRFDFQERIYPYLLNQKDTIFIDDEFLSPESITFYRYFNDSAAWGDYCYGDFLRLGNTDNQKEKKRIGFRLNEPELILGWIEFERFYDEATIHRVVYREFN
ncbi:MAG: hypothetical protein AB8G22_13510 [Saprospiraceae bacterium]